MRCLVTGCAGFIGSSLTDRLLSEGHEVVGVDCFLDYYARDLKEANLRNARDHRLFEFIESDLLEVDLQSLLGGVDWIFHQAAQAGVRASWGEYFSTYTRNNIDATQKLLETARGVDSIRKIVFASSSSIYGNAESRPTSETTIPCPVSPYGVTKLAAEHLMSLYASEFGLPTVSLRYFTVYGPRQRPDMAFRIFSTAALKNEEIVIFGDGEQSRDFTYIDDIVSANVLAAERGVPGNVYNVGGGSVVSVNEVLEMLDGMVGEPMNVSRRERSHGDARHTSADISKVRKDLGYQPSVALAEGLQREVEWVSQILK